VKPLRSVARRWPVPAGQEDYDLLRGDPAEVEAARERIAALPAPPQDPVGGGGVAQWG